MPGKHFYKHLDKQESANLNVNINMEKLAKIVDGCDYGLHRFLSEIIDIKLKSRYKDEVDFAKELESLLNKGYF